MPINIDGSKGIRQNTTEVTTIPVGTTAQRPASPVAGMMRFNTDEGRVEGYNDRIDEWQPINQLFQKLAATGGTVTDITQDGQLFRVHTFTSDGTFEVTAGGGEVDVFLVGGGGSGGGERGGGGGGSAKSHFGIFVQKGNKQVTVGAGGIHPGTVRSNAPGEDSFFINSDFIAEGGQVSGSPDGGSGGSGGGGSSTSSSRVGGDGGSDGGDGEPGSNGAGGSGQGFSTREFNQIFLNGSWQTIDPNSNATLYAGGGGGGGDAGSPGFGGAGGGGNSVETGLPTNGVPNTGGGGGSTASSDGDGAGNGGSGIVIVRYRLG